VAGPATPQQPSVSQTAMTAADGSSTLSDLADGTYLLTALAPGYGTSSLQVTLTSGTVATVEIRLQPLPGSLTGTVTNAVSGAPVAGATVTLAQWSVQTDADGHYNLAGLTPGAYTMQVSSGGYQMHEAGVSIGPGTSGTANIALTPLPGSLVVKVVDALTGGPVAGATLSYGATTSPDTGAMAADDLPCADVKLLVPLKRSAEFAAVRRRVADHRHLDAWVEDGLHFFVFQLHAAEGGAAGSGTNGAAPGRRAAQAPVAVFAMQPEATTPHSAVVVTPSSDGAEAEIMDLRAPDGVYTAPVA
jgi:hypothetical protein